MLDGFQGGWCAQNGQAVEVAEGFRRLHYVEQVNALFGGGREELVQLGVAELILPLVLLGCDTWRHGVRVEVDGLTGKSRDVLGAQREVVHRPRVLQPTERRRAEQPGAQVGQALLTQCVACIAAGTWSSVIGYALYQVSQTLRRDVVALGGSGNAHRRPCRIGVLLLQQLVELGDYSPVVAAKHASETGVLTHFMQEHSSNRFRYQHVADQGDFAID